MRYRVTDVQGPRPEIAGKRRKAGDVIVLNKSEAQFEVMRGTVELYQDKTEPTNDPAAELVEQTQPLEAAQDPAPSDVVETADESKRTGRKRS